MDASERHRAALRTAVLLFLGTLLLQTAWILTLPPFRGTDEFDHAFRAAEVAEGHWAASHKPATSGRGNLVEVPRSLVEAASPICWSYEYTGPDNCAAVRSTGTGRVLVASAASAYNPAYYFVVGTAGKPFHGATSLYVMRIASSVLCSLFMALAGWVTALWARTRWPMVAVVVATTPVMGFSLAIVAPNGLEMSAAMSAWMALLGVCTREGRRDYARPLLVAATSSAIVITTLRALGPLWITLIVVTTAFVLGWRPLWRLVGRHKLLMGFSTALVTAATLASVGWTHFSATQQLPTFDMGKVTPSSATLEQVPLWFLQGIAAFPRRADAAPPLVYVLIGLVFLALVVPAWLASPARTRFASTACLTIAVAVPAVFTYTTIASASPLWQGRYGLPFHLGVTLLAGYGLDRTRRSLPDVRVLVAFSWVGLIIANVAAVVHVLHREETTSPLAGSAVWVEPPTWLVAAFVIGAFGAWAAAVMTTPVRVKLARPNQMSGVRDHELGTDHPTTLAARSGVGILRRRPST